MPASHRLTIGQLAQRLGIRTSALRYYEQEGLLAPSGRSEAGYRFYAPEAEDVVRFIQRAQQLGFSLSDIRTLLQARPGDDVLLKVAQDRFLALERQITGLLILRRELELFLADFNHLHLANVPALAATFEQLGERLAPAAAAQPAADATLDWLLRHTGCNLTVYDTHTLLDALRGRHLHIWQDEGETRILLVGHDAAVEAALGELARIEAACHAHRTPRLAVTEDGYLFTAQGENAFLFARLFLALG
ncbi:MAG: MerR family transcriptional regulator [Chloroflexota bacterium]